jgi:hypothetical protein
MLPHLIIMDKVVLLEVIFKIWGVSVRHKWCPRLTIKILWTCTPPLCAYKHHTKYQSCSSKTVGGDSRTNHVSIYLSFWEYLMKTVGGVNRTNHVPFMQLVRKKWLSSTTCHFENICRKSKSCGQAHLHYVYKYPTKY